MTPDQVERVAEVLGRRVVEEVRGALLLQGPVCVHDVAPPNAVRDEERIVSALLEGATRFENVAPLTPGDFFDPLHRAVVTVLLTMAAGEGPPALEVIASVLHEQGCAGPIAEELAKLRDGVPVTLHLEEHVAAVREMSRRRRLSAFLRKVDTDLRLGQIDTDAAIERLRGALSRRGQP